MEQQKNAQANEAEGKSQGGLSSKIHAAVDALGNLVRFILTEGPSLAYDQADAIIEGFQADFVLADQGYDANDFIEKIQASGAVAVIPARKNRIEGRYYDKTYIKNVTSWNDCFKN
jgi:transposase